jgi:quaternary ammonium compound-resistance protein SugE
MPWVVLVLSGLCEAVWATALGESHGFSQPVPTVVFFVFCVVSMLGLGWAVKQIPIGTAYAVWTGIGAALTVTWAMVTGAEAVSVWKVVFLVGVIGAVVGLKLVPSSAEVEAESAAERAAGPAGGDAHPGTSADAEAGRRDA